ncbi:MAG: MFS transporter [Bacillota bacterium]|nr:MFS transporter [Bacillota bacterium]
MRFDNKKRRSVVMLYLFVFMAAFGISGSMFGTLQPGIIKYYGLNLKETSLFVVVQEIGILISMTVTALWADRVNKNRLIGVSFLLMGLFLYMMGMAPAFYWLLAVRAFLGMASFIGNNTCSSHVSDLYGPDRSKNMALLHTFYGLGSLVGPAYAALTLRYHGWNWSYKALGMASSIIALMFLVSLSIVKEPVPFIRVSHENGKRTIPFSKLLKSKNLHALGAASACISAFQLLPVWLPTYLIFQNPKSFTVENCSVIMTLYYVGMVLSRFCYSYLSGRLAPQRYIKAACAVSAAMLVPALIFQLGWFLYICLFVTGLISGALYTTQYLLACQEFPENSAGATSVISLFSALGSMLINASIGFIADCGFFTPAMFVPVLFIAAAPVIISLAYKPVKDPANV